MFLSYNISRVIDVKTGQGTHRNFFDFKEHLDDDKYIEFINSMIRDGYLNKYNPEEKELERITIIGSQKGFDYLVDKENKKTIGFIK